MRKIMVKKILIILFIIVIAVILIGIASLLLFNRPLFNDLLDELSLRLSVSTELNRQSKVDNNSPTTTEEIKKIKINTSNTEPTEEPAEILSENNPVDKDDLKRMAASFAERFGSYSNQSNYSNIVDLKIFMSIKMVAWAENFVREQRRNNMTEIYYGITTKAINEEVLDFDEDNGSASILVQTRRREANGTVNNVSNFFNQNITIIFMKEDGIWKVDSANWQI